MATAFRGDGPMRTCIATRRRLPAHQLLRVCVDREASAEASAAAGRPVAVVVADPRKVLPGRGASITPTLAAVETAITRRAFGRALRVSAQVDTSALVGWLSRHTDDRCE